MRLVVVLLTLVDQIAASYWYLHTQPRTCFTYELDVRNAVEKW